MNDRNWIKSSYSPPNNNDCVEVSAGEGGAVHVQDSKNPGAAELSFTSSEWQAFILGAKDGEFDHLI